MIEPCCCRHTLRSNHCDDASARYQHHLNPRKFVVNAAGIDLCQLYIIGHDIADLVQRLVIFAARVNQPDTALIERITPRLFLCFYNCITHADTPQVRIISIPSSLRRAFVHTGSQTTSILTSLTSGSCNRRSRISSMMKSIAGQPIAVKVSLRSTTPSCWVRSTIRPISTTLMGSSGSITSRKASHRAGQEV